MCLSIVYGIRSRSRAPSLAPLKGFVGAVVRWKSSMVRFPPKWTNGCLMPSSSILPVPMRRSWFPESTGHPPFGRSCSGLSLLLAVLALAAAWRWSPLGTWIEIPRLLAYVEAFERSPAAPFITIAGFLIGGLLVAPVTVLITVTVLAFGPMQGFLYSFAGMTLSAILTFYLGGWFGQRLVDRISPRLQRLSVRLAEKGVLAVVAVRVVPVAPFTIVNMVAGATRIRLKDFVVGTIIGELPGLIALSIFVDQITTTIKSPGPASYAVLAVTAAAIIAIAWMLRQWLAKRTAAQASERREHASGAGDL